MMKASQIAALAMLPVILAGCGTLDVASRRTGPPPTCNVHGLTMAPEIIKMSPGEIDYVPEYWKPSQEQFPHHGGWLYRGERSYGRTSRRVRDFVCADCTEDFQTYWKERRRKT